ncbi:DASS family sodium-coupled anion symporter, partial [Solidesulfovibrio sp.]|uniref:DASS family sodium-coupled anion symporter n=1 Tax=Solidesulfovibrio sp. TaxID=2910990 RepID=UPI00260BB2DA
PPAQAGQTGQPAAPSGQATQAAPPAQAAPAPAAAPAKITPASQIKWALSGFADPTVWLVFAAFIFAQGYEKTGLGRRIALLLLRFMGRSTLGLGYAVAMSDLCLAPFLPSNTARCGGTIYPIIRNIPPLFGSTPENDPRKIGSYLMWVALASTCVTSAAFLTSFAPNFLAVSMVQKIANIDISWTQWFLAMLPACLVLFLATPYLVYLIYPPTQKSSPEAPIWAGKELAALGPMSRGEIVMAVLAVCALMFWIFGGKLVNATTVALVAVGLMIPFRVVTWDDLLGNKPAWNILFWYGTLMAVADGLYKVGFLNWFCTNMASAFSGFGTLTMIILLVTIFWYASFFFASITALTTALFPPFLMAAMLVPGLPLKMFILLMCGSLGLRGILTPYAVTPAIIIYGSGYIATSDHWRLGFIFSTLYLVVFLALGIPSMSMFFN